MKGISKMNKWLYTARKSQLPPKGDWDLWLYTSVHRAVGKTRTGAEWVKSKIVLGYKNGAIIIPYNEYVYYLLDKNNPVGLTRVLELNSTKDATYNPNERELCIHKYGDTILKFFNHRDYDRLKGVQFEFTWVDELKNMSNKMYWLLRMITRLRYPGHGIPQMLITTTSDLTETLIEVIRSDGIVITCD